MSRGTMNSQEAIAILTSGGNCPGLNDAICGVIQRAQEAKLRALGVPNGFEGLLTPVELTEIRASLQDLRRRPGSILGLCASIPHRPEKRSNLKRIAG